MMRCTAVRMLRAGRGQKWSDGGRDWAREAGSRRAPAGEGLGWFWQRSREPCRMPAILLLTVPAKWRQGLQSAVRHCGLRRAKQYGEVLPSPVAALVRGLEATAADAVAKEVGINAVHCEGWRGVGRHDLRG